ncbi:MAG: hypothetical protein M3137_15650 [Actinomycetota bacterium]|nr:hypothetical protein [Actinomycetota bacterium]
MGVGVSIVIAAVGAVLRFAVTVNDSHGFNIHKIGVILLIVGIVGLIVSLFFLKSWGGFGGGGGGYQRRRVSRTPGRTYRDRDGRIVEEPGAVVEERDRF